MARIHDIDAATRRIPTFDEWVGRYSPEARAAMILHSIALSLRQGQVSDAGKPIVFLSGVRASWWRACAPVKALAEEGLRRQGWIAESRECSWRDIELSFQPSQPINLCEVLGISNDEAPQ